MIVGNKVDLDTKDEISFDEINQFAMGEGAMFKYTSAKDGKGVDDLFNSIV